VAQPTQLVGSALVRPSVRAALSRSTCLIHLRSHPPATPSSLATLRVDSPELLQTDRIQLQGLVACRVRRFTRGMRWRCPRFGPSGVVCSIR
jgi:hypothetical protein